MFSLFSQRGLSLLLAACVAVGPAMAAPARSCCMQDAASVRTTAQTDECPACTTSEQRAKSCCDEEPLAHAESFRDCECCSHSPIPGTSESRRPVEDESRVVLEYRSDLALADLRTASHSAASDRDACFAQVPPRRVLHCCWLT